MLVGVMMAYSKCQRQIEASERVEVACEHADRLLYRWTADGVIRPPAQAGQLSDGWSWMIERKSTTLPNLDIVELQMIHNAKVYERVQLVLAK